VGDDPFGPALDEAVRNQPGGGRPVVVRRLASIGPDSGCHVLFVARSPAQTSAEALRAVAGQPVLTVADAGPGTEASAIVFVIQDGHVRFDIHEEVCKAAGLVVSSKLLGLSVSRRRTE
ncbi:YfiR family protein, partial [Streptomyces roseoverticillatus]|uniref:YfiR family protein n=1 Tax=Streptomyces roseoverticillatus TaxID=66429 RepID=UPI001F40FB7E